jgi:hypothetical protein
MDDQQEFNRRLRLYDQHKIFLYGGLIIAGLGIIAAPWGLPLVALGGIAEILAGLRAREGGRSAVRSIGAGVHGSFGRIGYYREWTTREMESMSNQERVDHARLTGTFGIAVGAIMILGAIAVLVGWLKLPW